jgi:predicted transcriptional regulator of viral defense system
MRSLDFFETHPVFRHDEYLESRAALGRSARTSDNLLALHLRSARIQRVRRGLYAVVPRREGENGFNVDPYLVASKITEDSVVVYHAALQFFGKTYSIWNRFHYGASKRARPFSFRGLEFIPVLMPSVLRAIPGSNQGIVEKEHAGGRVRVTSLERTLVDVLDQPDKCGGWEETWRSLELVEFFDLDAVISYVRLLASAITAARVGFYLEQHRESLMIEEKHLESLRKLAPAQPRYIDGARKSGKLIQPWNLVVPENLLSRRWEETA